MLAGMLGLSGAGGRAQTGPPPLTLHLTTNQAILGPGSTLEATVGVTYTGAPQGVDLLFGAILPDGDSVVAFGPGMASASARVSRLSTIPVFYGGLTLAAGVHAIVPDLLRYTFNGSEPLGTYRLFFAATTPGAFRDDRIDPGDVVAVQFADIVVRPPATVTVDPSHAGSGSVGPAGGSVTATGADGTVFTLDVPRGALARPTTITLTPVTSLTGAPGALQHVRAVRATPDGLHFAIPAQLRVTPPTAVPARGWFGIGLTSAGAGLDLTPAGAAGGTIVAAVVQHFSVLGVAIPTLITLPPTSLSTYDARIAAATTPAEYDAIYREWFTAVVDPLLRSGQSDAAALFEAMSQYIYWDFHRLVTTETASTAHAEALHGKTLLADGLRATLARLQGACLAAPRLATAEEVLALQHLAWHTFQFMRWEHLVPFLLTAPIPIHADLHDLDLASVLPLLCVKAEIVSTTFPGTIQQGVATPMTVQAGLRFTNGQITPTPPLQIAIDATGATPAQRTGLTNGAGTYATTFTPTSGSLTFDITAALVDGNYPYLSLAPLLATTRLTRTTGGVVVTPSQTTIAPGQSRQFTANQSVTWTVSGGGTITSSGMFTSNSTQGVFFVTATSVVDPTEVGIAQVTVAVPTMGSYEIIVRNSGVQGVASVGATSRSFSRPLAQAQQLADEMKTFIAPASILTSVSIVFASDVQTDVTLNVDLSGYAVMGGPVSIAAGPNAGGLCVIPSRPNVRLQVGAVDGFANVQACAGTFELVTGPVSRGVAVTYVQQGAQATLRAPRVGEHIAAVECRGGRVTIEAATAASLQLGLSDQCTFSIANTTFSDSVQVTNVQASVLGPIAGANLGAVSMRFNPGTTYALQAASVGRGAGTVLELEGTQTRLSDLAIGNINGIVRMVGNAGFSNSDAHAFLDARGHSGTRTIVGNVP